MQEQGQTGSLDQQLKQRLAQTGRLSSADVVAAAEPAEAAPAPVVGDIKASAPAAEFDDPLLSGKQATDGSTLAAGADTGLRPDPMDTDLLEAELTEQERDLFLDAIVTNERFCLSFSIFNGRITGVVRSRTQAETRAILSQLQREIREKRIQTDPDYILRLRSMLLAAQIKNYNGTVNPELAEPLWWVRQASGDETAPGWLAQADGWQNLDEALATALYEEIRKFEVKYWMMARHAGDQNFWQTAAST